MGWSGSLIQPDHDPTYTRGNGSPADAIASALWQAVTPEPQCTIALRIVGHRREPCGEFRAGQETTVAEIAGEGDVDRAGDVAGDAIDRFGVAGISRRVATVDDHTARGDVRDDLAVVRQRRRGPRNGRPLDRFERTGTEPLVDWRAIGAAIEERGRLADDPQHPHQPGGVGTVVGVERDHGVARVDPGRAEGGGERFR